MEIKYGRNSSTYPVQSEARGQKLEVYPNPAHDKLTVSIDAKEDADFVLQLRDVSGRIVYSDNISVAAGLNSYEIGLTHFSKGVYLLEANSSGYRWKTKVVVE